MPSLTFNVINVSVSAVITIIPLLDLDNVLGTG